MNRIYQCVHHSMDLGKMAVNRLSYYIPFGMVFCVQQSASLFLQQPGIFRIRQLCPRDWLNVPAKDQYYSLRKIIIMILCHLIA